MKQIIFLPFIQESFLECIEFVYMHNKITTLKAIRYTRKRISIRPFFCVRFALDEKVNFEFEVLMYFVDEFELVDEERSSE